MCVCARVCVSVKLHRRKKSISDVMKMQIVSLVSTCTVSQHHNAPSLFTLSQNGLQSITALSHFHHSLQINQSPLLLCSLCMSIPYSSIDFSELFRRYRPFQQFPSILFRVKLLLIGVKKVGDKETNDNAIGE